MISYIRGELIDLEEEKIIVDVHGVGYGIFMPNQAMGQLPEVGKEVKLHTYLNVREDAMQLFGFLTKDDLYVFKLVIGVSGIGPKGGLSVLSTLTPNDLRFAVMAGDVKAIQSTPGIGKKTAEKLIIELKDKLSVPDMILKEGGKENTLSLDNDIMGEAIQALVSLGYGNTESLQAVKKVSIESDMRTEDVLKQALKYVVF